MRRCYSIRCCIFSGIKAVNPKYETLGETVRNTRRHQRISPRWTADVPGHPEYRWTSGIETTTGPLGQGVATSVGMAIAERWMASYFNRPDFKLFDYDVYAIAGDGCMMEGCFRGEAASLGGSPQTFPIFAGIYDKQQDKTIEGKYFVGI